MKKREDSLGAVGWVLGVLCRGRVLGSVGASLWQSLGSGAWPGGGSARVLGLGWCIKSSNLQSYQPELFFIPIFLYHLLSSGLLFMKPVVS